MEKDFFGDFKEPPQRVFRAPEAERTCKRCGWVYPSTPLGKIFDEARYRELHPQEQSRT